MQLWFQEEQDNHIRMAYKTKEILFRGRSDFQTVDVIETEAYGKMMLIDGLVMVSEKDEFVYHELIAHIPALLHRKPSNALVIGGGDGGTVRELLRHPSIEKITLCEIDQLVIDVAKQYFPNLSCGFSDPRTELFVGDGIGYVANLEPQSLDLIIIDSTDPIGPGEGLFTADFYRNVAKALKPDGIMVCQSESIWYDRVIHQKIQGNLSAGFKHRLPYIGFVPTYPQGLWSWTLASHQELDPGKIDTDRFAKMAGTFSYLTKDLLQGCFALPQFFIEKTKV